VNAVAQYKHLSADQFDWQLQDTPISFGVNAADDTKAGVLEEMSPKPPSCEPRRHLSGRYPRSSLHDKWVSVWASISQSINEKHLQSAT